MPEKTDKPSCSLCGGDWTNNGTGTWSCAGVDEECPNHI